MNNNEHGDPILLTLFQRLLTKKLYFLLKKIITVFEFNDISGMCITLGVGSTLKMQSLESYYHKIFKPAKWFSSINALDFLLGIFPNPRAPSLPNISIWFVFKNWGREGKNWENGLKIELSNCV